MWTPPFMSWFSIADSFHALFKSFVNLWNWWKTWNFPSICIIYAKLNTFFDHKYTNNFWSKEVETLMKYIFFAQFEELYHVVQVYFDFENPPKKKNLQFSGLAILSENSKNRKLRKNCGFSSLVTFKFGFSTLKLTKINCKRLVADILKKKWNVLVPLDMAYATGGLV